MLYRLKMKAEGGQRTKASVSEVNILPVSKLTAFYHVTPIVYKDNKVWCLTFFKDNFLWRAERSTPSVQRIKAHITTHHHQRVRGPVKTEETQTVQTFLRWDKTVGLVDCTLTCLHNLGCTTLNAISSNISNNSNINKIRTEIHESGKTKATETRTLTWISRQCADTEHL